MAPKLKGKARRHAKRVAHQVRLDEKREEDRQIKEDNKRDVLERQDLFRNGTYGKVRRVDNLFEKKTPKYDQTSVIELCFLKTFSHPNIIKLDSYTTSETDISMMLEFGGMSIDKFNKWMSFERRTDSFETIFKQVISALCYFEKNKIVHGDLSSRNIVVDPITLKTKIIDFGSLYLDNRLAQYKTKSITFRALCSEDVNPPENLMIGINPTFDVYSVGCIFVEYMEDLKQPEKYKGLFSRMTEKDYKKRITPTEIMSFIDPKYKEKETKIEEVSGSYIKKYIDLNLKMRHKLIDWMFSVCERIFCNFAFVHSVHILDKFMYLTKRQILRTEFQAIGIQCVMIALMFVHADCIYDFDFSVHICANAFTEEKHKQIQSEILNTLDYKVYMKTFDQSLENVDYKKIKDIICSNDVLCQEQLAMIYHS